MKTLAEMEQQTVTRRLLEKDIQKQCVDWARKRGYWARKFSSQSQRSVPDYLFAKDLMVHEGKHGNDWARLFFAVEFKAPGKTSTDAQLDEQAAMREAGWLVLQVDNVEWFKAHVQKCEAELT